MSGHSTVGIQSFVNHAEIRTQRYNLASMEDVLHEVQNLETQHLSKSRFRRLTRRMEPLIDFLIRYSPAVDMMVQYEVAPSALIWGVLKVLLEVRHLFQNDHADGNHVKIGCKSISPLFSTDCRFDYTTRGHYFNLKSI